MQVGDEARSPEIPAAFGQVLVLLATSARLLRVLTSPRFLWAVLDLDDPLYIV